MRKKRKKGAEKRTWALIYIVRTIIILLGIGIGVFTFILIKTNGEYKKGDLAYDGMRQIFADANTESLKSDMGDISPMGVSSAKNFDSLKKLNEDIVAWILAEGRAIDYPIVQGNDNDYYMRRLINHESNKLGTIFMDYRSRPDFSDTNTLIYGHNIKDGSMFALLTEYKDQEYYNSFPDMVLYTPEGDYNIEFFAGIIADGNYEFVRYEFDDDMDFLEYIKSLKEESTFSSDTRVEPGDHIISLLTCSYEYNNARYALFGKLNPLKNVE